jgi:hypothetical protein
MTDVWRGHGDSARVLGMLAVVAAPVWATMHAVHAPPPWRAHAPNPTPYGYTVSLLIFLVPVATVAAWHAVHPLDREHRRAFSYSAGLIALAGSVLDLAFGRDFFTFLNRQATLDYHVPAWSFTTWTFTAGYLPIEEFLFYVLGGLFVISLYSWADGEWLNYFKAPQYGDAARWQTRIVHLNPASALLVAALGIGGFWLKSADVAHPGIPGYFLFLLLLGFLPTFLLLRGVELFVNWRAFTFAYSALLLVSLLWEVTLGVPYEWWNYQPRHLLGVRIVAWSNLPIEAVMVWLIVTWDAVIAFEAIRIFLHMQRPAQKAFFG